MSQKGSVVIFAFATAHIALILSAICLSTHYWIGATPKPANETSNHTSLKNTTVLTYSKGLWRYCYENETTMHYPKYHHGKNGTNGTVVYNYTTSTFESENCSDSWKELTNMTSGNETGSIVMFNVTQYAYADGVCTLAVGIILLYVFLCVQRARGSVCLAVVMTLLFFAAGGLFVVALIINGQHYQKDEDFSCLEDYQLSLEWSFFVGIAGNVFTFLCAFLSAYNVKLVRLSDVPYENLHHINA